METLIKTLTDFFERNKPVIIVNASTDKALLCLNPRFSIENNMLLMKFDSLNERGGNSVYIKSIQASEDNTLYIDNEVDNILALRVLTLEIYKYYIKPHYANSPEFTDLDALRKHILSQQVIDY